MPSQEEVLKQNKEWARQLAQSRRGLEPPPTSLAETSKETDLENKEKIPSSQEKAAAQALSSAKKIESKLKQGKIFEAAKETVRGLFSIGTQLLTSYLLRLGWINVIIFPVGTLWAVPYLNIHALGSWLAKNTFSPFTITFSSFIKTPGEKMNQVIALILLLVIDLLVLAILATLIALLIGIAFVAIHPWEAIKLIVGIAWEIVKELL